MVTFLKALVTFTVIGLATESCFNGVRDQVNRRLKGLPVDWQLPCRTWLWSILVFGLSAAISFPLLLALYPQIFGWHWLMRGLIYLLGIYAWEYFWGALLEAVLGKCPWEYEASPYRIWRYLRPRFAPLWFLYGFILEWTQVRLLPLLEAVGNGS